MPRRRGAAQASESDGARLERTSAGSSTALPTPWARGGLPRLWATIRGLAALAVRGDRITRLSESLVSSDIHAPSTRALSGVKNNPRLCAAVSRRRKSLRSISSLPVRFAMISDRLIIRPSVMRQRNLKSHPEDGGTEQRPGGHVEGPAAHHQQPQPAGRTEPDRARRAEQGQPIRLSPCFQWSCATSASPTRTPSSTRPSATSPGPLRLAIARTVAMWRFRRSWARL